ncbi:MAG: D-alanyl-D-alanine carboxypeptidase [Uliginosibacterium sp.]|nr:D-alanyl-D-alanine carboxypeptidase [Uliginosibacterium sp.]
MLAMTHAAFCRGCLLALATLSIAAEAALPEPVLRSVREAGIAPESVALWVGAANGGEPLMQHNAEQPMNPASVMKLLTTQAALDLLGPAYTWKTRAWLGGELRDGRLAGDMLIAGSGDPALSWDRLGEWLRDWRARGLREIRGDVVIDRSLIPAPAKPATQFDESPHRAYNARPDAFLVNFGALSLRLSAPAANGGVSAVSLIPASPLRIVNRLKASDGACVDWRNALRGSLQAEGAGFVVTLDGKFAASCGEKVYNLAVDDSQRWAGHGAAGAVAGAGRQLVRAGAHGGLAGGSGCAILTVGIPPAARGAAGHGQVVEQRDGAPGLPGAGQRWQRRAALG